MLKIPTPLPIYLSIGFLCCSSCYPSEVREQRIETQKPSFELVSSPVDFFDHYPPQNPTALFTIGISGSGKSTWSKAGHKEWIRIDSDQLLNEEIIRMADQGEILSELGVIPVPGNSDHFYLLRHRGHTLANELLQKTIADKRSFIWDSLGLNDRKDEISELVLAKGYQIWWLIFSTNSKDKNRYNLFLRESQGGFSSFRELNLVDRCRRLNYMLTTQLNTLTKIILTAETSWPTNVNRIFKTEVIDLHRFGKAVDPCINRSINRNH